MSFQHYLEQIQETLNSALAVDNASLIEFRAEIRSESAGYLAGVLQFEDKSELHFREYVDTNQTEPRLTYAYHYQDSNKALKFRYDNAAHWPALAQPDHKHNPQGIELTNAPTLQKVLDEIRI